MEGFVRGGKPAHWLLCEVNLRYDPSSVAVVLRRVEARAKTAFVIEGPCTRLIQAYSAEAVASAAKAGRVRPTETCFIRDLVGQGLRPSRLSADESMHDIAVQEKSWPLGASLLTGISFFCYRPGFRSRPRCRGKD